MAITASLQTHFEVFEVLGLNSAEATETMERSVAWARDVAPSGVNVAGSVGSYDVFLAHGVEYSGVYPGMFVEKLIA